MRIFRKPISIVVSILTILVAGVTGILLELLWLAADFEIALYLGMCLLFLIGLITGNRLVWRFVVSGSYLAMFLSILTFIVVVFIAITAEHEASSMLIISSGITALYVILFWLIFCAFRAKSTMCYFDLICPNCSSTKINPDDLLFKKAECKNCYHKW